MFFPCWQWNSFNFFQLVNKSHSDYLCFWYETRINLLLADNCIYLVVWTVHKLIDNHVSDVVSFYLFRVPQLWKMSLRIYYRQHPGHPVFWGPECKIRGSGRRKKEPRRKRSDLSREEDFLQNLTQRVTK